MSIQFKPKDSALEKAYDKLAEEYKRSIIDVVPIHTEHLKNEMKCGDKYLALEGEP